MAPPSRLFAALRPTPAGLPSLCSCVLRNLWWLVERVTSRDWILNGAPDTIRTCDLPLRRRMLYPAELRGQGFWWSRGGSNSRPSHCERDALPAELRPQ